MLYMLDTDIRDLGVGRGQIQCVRGEVRHESAPPLT